MGSLYLVTDIVKKP